MVANRVVNALRDIISQQMRLKKIPGRRPDAFICRPDFGDIIEYCLIARGDRKDVVKQVDWWEAQAKQQTPVPVPSGLTEETGAPQRKRKRRRRRQNPGAKNRMEGE
jgi:poly(A) polymerase